MRALSKRGMAPMGHPALPSETDHGQVAVVVGMVVIMVRKYRTGVKGAGCVEEELCVWPSDPSVGEGNC